MKKKVLASLLCASMVATMVAGCGSSDDKKGTESAKSDSGKTTITVMGPSEDLDDAQGAWLKTECEAFAKEHTEWDIDFEYVTTSESDAKDTVTKDPKAAADVYLFANDQIEALVKANGYDWMVHTTKYFEVGSHVGINVIPFNIQIMHKPESSDEKAVEIDA